MYNIQYDTLSLFPTPVGIYTLPREFTKDELSFVLNLKKRSNTGNQSSENDHVLNEFPLQDIRYFITSCLDEYFERVYRPKDGLKLRITQSWCNYTDTGGYHHQHTHPNSFVSGVFYFQTNKETDSILFCENSYKPFKIHMKDFSEWNYDSWDLPSVPGQLLLFPSSLDHSVEIRQPSKDTRVSLSFNTFFVGKLGGTNQFSELIL